MKVRRGTVFRVLAGLLLLGGLAACGSEGGGAEDTPPSGEDVAGFDIAGEDVWIADGAGRPDAADVGAGKPDVSACEREGTFGCPCVGNGDCASGYCVEDLEGFVCTVTCLTDCPGGYSCKAVLNTLPDVVFICVPDLARLCQPCRTDLQCSGGVCIEYEDGGYCSSPCPGGAGDCPSTFSCEEVTVGEATAPLCLPRTGSCSCRSGTEGQLRACQVANESGTCNGYETCDPATGWVGCDAPTPAAEVCNGADDDCDGRPDDGLTERPCAVENEAGRCEGLEVCLGAGGWVCGAREPAEEVCDYVDNDCDGVTDDPFVEDGVYATEDHCGACNVACEGSIPNAVSVVCDAARELPQCVVGACAPGYERLNDFQCIVPPQALCQPCRDDVACYGGLCRDIAGADYCTRTCTEDGDECPEGFVCATHADTGEDVCLPENGSCDCTAATEGARRSCSAENEYGVCFGFQRCDPASGWDACDASSPAPEECNGIDDDCDGLADDDVSAGEPCTRDNEFGSCPGTTVCYGPSGLQCSAPLAEPEVCDYVDNDCDGQTDDGFPDLYRSCSAGDGACLRYGFERCTDDGAGTACSAVAGEGAPEVCNGVDDDCNGQTDEDWPGRGAVCAVGLGACARAGVQVCDPSDPAGPVVCDAAPGDPGDELCNGADDDCDGATDEELAGVHCPVQVGVCEGAGQLCRGALGWQACDAATYIAHDAAWEAEEVTCDGHDNDCDGATDEDLPQRLCPQQTGVCAGATVPCEDGAWRACTAASYGPDYEADETRCDLLDNDCDGETDDGWRTGGVYASDAACGNCFTDCTVIYDRPQGYGVCDTSGPPTCVLLCDLDWFNLNAVPDDGCEFFLDPDAVYVSASDALADDLPGCGRGPAGTGEGNRPCRTIEIGLTEARSAGRGKVLVADGLYEEVVRLEAGIDLLGGYRADTWERHRDSTLTTLRAPVGAGHRKTIVAQDITTETRVEGFNVYGATPTDGGASSYAIWVRDCDASLVLGNNAIWAAAGAPGAGGGDGTSGSNGVAGSTGAGTYNTTCTVGATITNGGAGGVRQCQDPATFAPSVPATYTTVDGGRGGHAVCPDVDIQAGGGVAGGNSGGAGGAGGWGHYTDGSCYPTSGVSEVGAIGQPGGVPANQDGGGGAGGSGPQGTVTDGEWGAATGQPGVHGQHGRGGGGGGASGGQLLWGLLWDTFDIGGSGGGGGSGGCAGERGYGGTGGGGSFGIFVTWSPGNLPTGAADLPVVTGNRLTRGRGGDGGDGGNGGAGGTGGSGGPGGPLASYAGPIFCVFGGSSGGYGSRGGHAGGGGGGGGGASYDIVVWGRNGLAVDYATTNTFTVGAAVPTGGAGGSGGNASNTAVGLGAAGAAGAAGTVLLHD